MLSSMSIAEVEKIALGLDERQRALLAASLLRSLPAPLADVDEGIAEALRRDAAMGADPTQVLSLEQLDERVANRRC